MSAEDFWRWFADNAPAIAADPENGDLITALDQNASLTWPELGWEIGPDPSGGWYFALSPNMSRDLVIQSRQAIQNAPEILGWKFYATRQRKAWDGRFGLETEHGLKHFDCTDWKFLFLKYPDGEKELVLIAPDADSLNPDDRLQAAAVVIEGLLGEECVLSNVDRFALESTVAARLLAQAIPMRLLPQTFGLS